MALSDLFVMALGEKELVIHQALLLVIKWRPLIWIQSRNNLFSMCVGMYVDYNACIHLYTVFQDIMDTLYT